MRLTRIVFIFYILFCTLSCRKYRDDESITFTSPMKRLTAHSWEVVWFGVNNQDSSNRIYSVNSTSYKLMGETITLTRNDVSSGNVGTRYAASGTPVMFDFWALHGAELIGGKSTVTIDMAYGQYGLRVPPKHEWKILKLTATEFHISTNYNSKEYAIYFNKP